MWISGCIKWLNFLAGSQIVEQNGSKGIWSGVRAWYFLKKDLSGTYCIPGSEMTTFVFDLNYKLFIPFYIFFVCFIEYRVPCQAMNAMDKPLQM